MSSKKGNTSKSSNNSKKNSNNNSNKASNNKASNNKASTNKTSNNKASSNNVITKTIEGTSKNVEKTLEKNPHMVIILNLVLVLYILAIKNLSNEFLNMLDTILFKLIVAFVVLLLSFSEPVSAILLTTAFVLSLNELNNRDLNTKNGHNAKQIYESLKNKVFEIKKLTTENKDLYGSVKPTEISKIINQSENIDVKPSLIQPLNEIKSLGTFKVKINLHSEVQAEIKIKVISEDNIK